MLTGAAIDGHEREMVDVAAGTRPSSRRSTDDRPQHRRDRLDPSGPGARPVCSSAIPAPYGRHARTDWGPSISNQLGWCIMELVSLVVFAGLFLAGPNGKTAPMWVFFALWTAHYINRSLIFPWRTRTQGKTMPLAIVGSAAAFNVVNAGLNGLYLGWFGDIYPTEWLMDPRFIVGLVGVRCRRRASTSGPTTGSSACAPVASRATRSRAAACSNGSPAPTIWARSSSGRALR